MADISIEGTLGFYAIHGVTQRGKEWINQSVEGALHGAAYSDQKILTQAIADGATQEGLTVNVNGEPWRR